MHLLCARHSARGWANLSQWDWCDSQGTMFYFLNIGWGLTSLTSCLETASRAMEPSFQVLVLFWRHKLWNYWKENRAWHLSFPTTLTKVLQTLLTTLRIKWKLFIWLTKPFVIWTIDSFGFICGHPMAQSTQKAFDSSIPACSLLLLGLCTCFFVLPKHSASNLASSYFQAPTIPGS